MSTINQARGALTGEEVSIVRQEYRLRESNDTVEDIFNPYELEACTKTVHIPYSLHSKG